MTNSNVYFCDNDGTIVANIYIHGDGATLGERLKVFLQEVQKNVPDNRFHCASYLAPKFVVWMARKNKGGDYLDFLSIGIMQSDAGDIKYRYKVICNEHKGRAIPKIITEKV
jgi:hypothetical protein